MQRLANGQTEWLVQAKTPPADSLRVDEVKLSGSTGLSNSNYRLLMQRNAIDATPELHTHFDEAAASAIPVDSDPEQKTGAMVAATKTTHTTPSMAQLLGQSQEKLFRSMVDSQQQLLEKLERLETSQARMEAEMKASRGPRKLALQ